MCGWTDKVAESSPIARAQGWEAGDFLPLEDGEILIISLLPSLSKSYTDFFSSYNGDVLLFSVNYGCVHYTMTKPKVCLLLPKIANTFR